MIGRLGAARRALGPGPGPTEAGRAWQLRYVLVCATTERLLDDWLTQAPCAQGPRLRAPLAVLARQQRFGRGQRGRIWSSPPGGVWLSAALPWPPEPLGAASVGLAVAVGLALELEDLGLPVRIKWPNDLYVPGPGGGMAKLAGVLPGQRLQGHQVRWARVGVGLNARNPIPSGATNVALAAGRHQACPWRLSARVLRALDWAMAWADRPEAVRVLAEQRLWWPTQAVQLEGEAWHPLGLHRDGGVVLGRQGRIRVWHRRFDGGPIPHPPRGGPPPGAGP
ncbi:MAG: biotin--[acetyl-CoA-carboxylase] ligase [Cyanobacteria bacterium]|nr:biotin--[acetyl-CoA-carboxylase] ligase [Cyanobacteriota bacterium]